jgi:hypothetical protein
MCREEDMTDAQIEAVTSRYQQVFLKLGAIHAVKRQLLIKQAEAECRIHQLNWEDLHAYQAAQLLSETYTIEGQPNIFQQVTFSLAESLSKDISSYPSSLHPQKAEATETSTYQDVLSESSSKDMNQPFCPNIM